MNVSVFQAHAQYMKIKLMKILNAKIYTQNQLYIQHHSRRNQILFTMNSWEMVEEPAEN